MIAVGRKSTISAKFQIAYVEQDGMSGVKADNERALRPMPEKSGVRLFRSHERYTVNIRTLLHLRDRFQTTTIRNISIGGACLERAYAVLPGDHITLQLNNGRKLVARVIWWAYGRCGIAFESPLPESDPLLVEGATGRKTKLQQPTCPGSFGHA